MGLESVTNIADLVRTNPTGADAKSAGDDHLRNIKTALLNDIVGFPGAVTVTGADGGAANVYTLTPAYGTLVAYGNRMLTAFSPVATNTGSVTLNISGLGAKNVLSVSGAALIANDLVAGNVYSAFYNGTEFRLLSITKNYADQLAFGAVLPAQTGNSGKYLTTDGVSASWQFNNPRIVRSARTSNTILGSADRANLIDYTGAVNFTQTFSLPSAIADANGWWVILQNSGTAAIEVEAPAAVSTTSATSNSIAVGTNFTVATGLTIPSGSLVIVRRTSDPYNQRITGTVTSYNSGTGALVIVGLVRIGSGTFTDWTITTRPATAGIDGVASYIVYPKEVRTVYCDGTGFRSIVEQAYSTTLISTVTFVRPPGYVGIEMDLVGASGGSGSGSHPTGTGGGSGGAPGGSPARVRRRIIPFPSGTADVVSIGAGGNGGASQASNGTAGNNGTAGGNTSYAALAIAYGGAGGVGGALASNVTTSGSGSMGSGTSAAGASVLTGGLPSSISFGGTTAANNLSEGGGAGNTGGGAGGCTEWGGAGATAGNFATAGAAPPGGSSIFGVPAGGVGGWITNGTAAVNAAGGAAGSRNSYTAGGGAAGGTCGTVPTAGTAGAAAANDSEVGASGGGGGSSVTTNGQPGGAGGFPGGAPGGGGACYDGFSSGAGVNGTAGRAVLTGIV
jgi:hypothetical protein